MESHWRRLTQDLGLLGLRLGFGGFMLVHGWGKLQMLLEGQYDKFDPIGLGPTLTILLVVFAELVCAAWIMLGLATRFSAAVLTINMAVAAFVAHASDPWTMGEGARLFTTGAAANWSSKEPALLFLIPFAALVLLGAGQFSLDAYVWPAIQRRWLKRPSAGGGGE